MTELDEMEIVVLIESSIMSGKASRTLPEDFEMDEKTKMVLAHMIRSLRIMIEEDTRAQITLCMGFIQGYRHGRGDDILANLSFM